MDIMVCVSLCVQCSGETVVVAAAAAVVAVVVAVEVVDCPPLLGLLRYLLHDCVVSCAGLPWAETLYMYVWMEVFLLLCSGCCERCMCWGIRVVEQCMGLLSEDQGRWLWGDMVGGG